MTPTADDGAVPADHEVRLARAWDSLQGLSVGDAFGQQYFGYPEWIAERTLPPGPWYWTDDTAMAVGVFDVLAAHRAVDQDELAQRFAEAYANEPHRGYGGTAHSILTAIHRGSDWRTVATAAFDGSGSMGNGAAMRVAPLGAYFADDLDAAVCHAERSAAVTHAHADGIAGAVAIAVAAAIASVNRGRDPAAVSQEIWTAVLDRAPRGPTREGIEWAAKLSPTAHVDTAAGRLGSGNRLISSDTVPFCLWNATRRLNDFEDALWTTVAGLGDRDTTCAIVGGIVASYCGADGIPELWRLEREPLPTHFSE